MLGNEASGNREIRGMQETERAFHTEPQRKAEGVEEVRRIVRGEVCLGEVGAAKDRPFHAE